MAIATLERQRARVKRVARNQGRLAYAVVTFDHEAVVGSEVMDSGLSREEADAIALRFNEVCERSRDTFRAAVVLQASLHPKIYHWPEGRPGKELVDPIGNWLAAHR